jgi:hypothetical protein
MNYIKEVKKILCPCIESKMKKSYLTFIAKGKECKIIAVLT